MPIPNASIRSKSARKHSTIGSSSPQRPGYNDEEENEDNLPAILETAVEQNWFDIHSIADGYNDTFGMPGTQENEATRTEGREPTMMRMIYLWNSTKYEDEYMERKEEKGDLIETIRSKNPGLKLKRENPSFATITKPRPSRPPSPPPRRSDKNPTGEPKPLNSRRSTTLPSEFMSRPRSRYTTAHNYAMDPTPIPTPTSAPKLKPKDN